MIRLMSDSVYCFRLKADKVKEVSLELSEKDTVDDIRNRLAEEFQLQGCDPNALVFVVAGQILNRNTVLSNICMDKLPEGGVIHVFQKPFAEPIANNDYW